MVVAHQQVNGEFFLQKLGLTKKLPIQRTRRSLVLDICGAIFLSS